MNQSLVPRKYLWGCLENQLLTFGGCSKFWMKITLSVSQSGNATQIRSSNLIVWAEIVSLSEARIIHSLRWQLLCVSCFVLEPIFPTSCSNSVSPNSIPLQVCNLMTCRMQFLLHAGSPRSIYYFHPQSEPRMVRRMILVLVSGTY